MVWLLWFAVALAVFAAIYVLVYLAALLIRLGRLVPRPLRGAGPARTREPG